MFFIINAYMSGPEDEKMTFNVTSGGGSLKISDKCHKGTVMFVLVKGF